MTSCPAGHLLQTKTFETRAAAEAWARAIEVEMDKGVFVSRAEADSATLKELLERYLAEIAPLKKGATPEAARLRAFMKYRLAQRFVAGIHGLDIARFRDERLGRVSTGAVKRDLVILGHVFEVARKERGARSASPVPRLSFQAGFPKQKRSACARRRSSAAHRKPVCHTRVLYSILGGLTPVEVAARYYPEATNRWSRTAGAGSDAAMPPNPG